MNRSESINGLAKALALAQAELEGARKDAANPFFKSSYATLASVWDAIREPFTKNGLSFIQAVDFDPAFPDHIFVETVMLHTSGEFVSGRMGMKPVKNDPQSFGSATTYARRYGLQALSGVAPEDDDGNVASAQGKTPVASKKETSPPAVKPVSKFLDPGSPLHKKIEILIKEAGIDRELFKEWLFTTGWVTTKDDKLSLSTMTEIHANRLVDKWESAKTTFGEWKHKTYPEEVKS